MIDDVDLLVLQLRLRGRVVGLSILLFVAGGLSNRIVRLGSDTLSDRSVRLLSDSFEAHYNWVACVG